MDVDLIAPDDISGVLDSLGFVKAPGDRHWFHEDADYIHAQINKEAGALEIRRIVDTWATVTTDIEN